MLTSLTKENLAIRLLGAIGWLISHYFISIIFFVKENFPAVIE